MGKKINSTQLQAALNRVKSETMSANHATVTAVTLQQSKWSNDVYSFEDTWPSAQYDIEVDINGDSATSAQYGYWAGAQIVGSATKNQLRAIGGAPNRNIPVVVRATKKT